MGLAPVNRDSSRISRLAVCPRSAWIRSTAAASDVASESVVSASNVSAASIARSIGNAHSIGCVRLKTSPASGMLSCDSRSTKKDASRSASGSAADTTTNWVPRRFNNA
ncbi:Uncharacterised protein [Mycobacterium tuberculosis]|nr:Uncharacterised protein [Mycobacterium tuberculosis]CFS11130.1 Uncharacterised protein [Mycobacterium tuberculosis]CFS13212.1 Uncharacterised protein [Mycobacterium tuberculosis]CKM39958.1 Uncharacterised protein [Mycobacterium tuberculosis]CKM40860.1 Uncharacterised protein [Mycobacterium tuberculosis]